MPTTSVFPDIDIPNTDIWSLIFEDKSRPYPDDKVLLVDSDTGRSYTFAQLKATATEFGKGLVSAWEWEKKDVLALYTPNNIDVPPVIWGAHWAGAIVTPANPTYSVDELTFQLKNSEAKALVTQKPFLATALKAAKNAGIPDDRVILIGDGHDETAKFKHFTRVRNLAGTSRFRRYKVKDPAQEIAFLVYSSGTTGLPKGVMLSHRNVVANVLQLAVAEENHLTHNGGPDGKGDRVIAVLPFFHIYGLTCIIHFSIRTGSEIHVMAKFELERFCQIIQQKKITFAMLVPPIILLLAKSPVASKYDLSSLRMINSGAAPLTREVVDAFYEKHKVPVKQGYGLSETAPSTHTQPWGEWTKSFGSVGKLLPNITAKYMDEEGKEVPTGQAGELWVKGPNVFLGYLKNPEGTANAITPDGFFKTGDVGYVDKNNDFYITDRVKELIKYKGFQVPPAELEGKLLAHPKIYDVAVLGIYKKEDATEVPRAYVTLHPGNEQNEATAKEIADWLAAQVAPHKKLRGGVKFIDAIPKSVTGKILRRVLKDMAKKEDEAPKAKL